MTDSELISLLRDALRLWGVAGQVAAGVTVTTPSGEVMTVRRGESPLRWWLATTKRTRPIASIGALLEAVRSAMGVAPGVAARIGRGAGLSAPPPLEGGGWGEGCAPGDLARPSPPPTLLPQGEGKFTTPISVITGFLGSGKTTLVSRLLRSPALARTAVIVNEFGEIGLDHELIERGDDTVLVLTTGCLCCAVQTDIARTLADLARRRANGAIAFDRVLVETSGLADPVPVLHALMTDDAVGAIYGIGAVVTLIDAQLGEATLSRHPEARRQAGIADLLVISKSDLAALSDSLATTLRALNADASIVTSIEDPEALFAPAPARATPEATALHTREVTAITIESTRPTPALALTLFIQALSAQCGARMLRLKGLVELAEWPGRPTVVHGVQHVFSPPAPLEAWPGADRHTRIVVIGQAIPPWFPARLLDAIVAEVEDEIDRANLTIRDQIKVVSTPSLAAPISAASDIGRP